MLLWMTFSLGIASVSLFPHLPSTGLMAATYAGISVLVLCLKQTKWLVVFVLGISYGLYHAHQLSASLLPHHYEGRVLQVTGEVVGLPRSFKQYDHWQQAFDFVVTEVEKPLALNRLRLRWSQPLDNPLHIQPGQKLSFLVRLKRPQGLANPGTRDTETQRVIAGISALGRVEQLVADKGFNHFSIDHLRQRLVLSLNTSLQHTQFARLYRGIIVGDKRGMTDSDWQRFNQSGTTHLMVISGLHIALIAAIAYYLGVGISLLLRSLGLQLKPELIPVAMAISVSAVYMMAAGLSLPTQRAWLMLSIAMLCLLLRRRFSSHHLLLLCISVCLIVYPFSLLSVSFWLSFGCVTAIMLLVSGLRSSRGRVISFASLQCRLSLLLLLPLALIIGQLSLASALCNLFMIPLFSFLVVPFTLLAALLNDYLPVLSLVIWLWLDQLLLGAFALIDSLQLTRWAVKPTTAYSSLVCLLMVLGIVVWFIAKGLNSRWLIALMLLPLLTSADKTVEIGGMRLTVLDVGQGLSVLIETAEHSMLYDVGAAYIDHRGDLKSMAQSVVLPVLKARGIENLDVMTISHNDIDHAGNWPLLVDNIPIASIHSGQDLQAMPVHNCHQQPAWQWDGVRFSYLDTTALRKQNTVSNNDSCVLKITAPGGSVLIPGDIEREIELGLIEQDAQALNVDILLAPHHGSKTSSSWPWIKTVQPEKVIFSAGYHNRFGHPHRDIVSRYQILGAEIINTANAGAYTLIFSDYGIELEEEYRQSLRRFWR